jgi:hypothetical protein
MLNILQRLTSELELRSKLRRFGCSAITWLLGSNGPRLASPGIVSADPGLKSSHAEPESTEYAWNELEMKWETDGGSQRLSGTNLTTPCRRRSDLTLWSMHLVS